MKTEYQVVPIDAVLRYYAAGFQTRSGDKPRFSRAFIDTAQKSVVFELYVENDQQIDSGKAVRQSGESLSD